MKQVLPLIVLLVIFRVVEFRLEMPPPSLVAAVFPLSVQLMTFTVPALCDSDAPTKTHYPPSANPLLMMRPEKVTSCWWYCDVEDAIIASRLASHGHQVRAGTGDGNASGHVG